MAKPNTFIDLTAMCVKVDRVHRITKATAIVGVTMLVLILSVVVYIASEINGCLTNHVEVDYGCGCCELCGAITNHICTPEGYNNEKEKGGVR